MSADLSIDPLRFTLAAMRYHRSKNGTQRPGNGDDRRIVEEIVEEGLDGRRRIGTTQVEEHDRRSVHGLYVPQARTVSTRSATCDGGVSLRIPCPRLKM